MKNLTEEKIKVQESKTMRSLETEWLETNGLGSYSSSTVNLCHTRKYHGLLVSASHKASKRTLLISKFDETLYINGEARYFSCHYYQPGIYTPIDLKTIFDNSLHPYSSIKHKDFSLQRGLIMLSNEDTVLVSYKFSKLKSKDTYLELKPLVAFRDFHSVLRENLDKKFKLEKLNDGVLISAEGVEQSLFIQINCDFELIETSYWYRNFLLIEEANRGYPAVEDLYCPIAFKININSNPEFIISLSTQTKATKDLTLAWLDELSSRKSSQNTYNTIFNLADKKVSLLNKLEKARKDFIINTDADNYSILAGYPWFNSWGRDTFISAPGLLMKSKDRNLFFNILKNYLNLQKDGLLPNMTGSSREDSVYNCIDASLWMFWALEKFLDESDSIDWIIDIWQELRTIYLAYYSNQAPGVNHHDNGLLETGSIYDTLSWMDARVDGKAASPRYGYLVEINALWFNASQLMHELSTEFNDDEITKKTSNTVRNLRNNFVRTFWIEEKGYFADHVHNGIQNTQLRPNQIFALGLESIKINPEYALSAIDAVTEKLLTPYGLRTLSPDDKEYRVKYQGDDKSRDMAYHNGTVWPWLIGAYTDAVLKYSSNKSEAKSKLRRLLLAFDQQFDQAGLNSISEIFDATEPFKARGCIAQAWSVSEVRRALLKV